MQPLKCLLLLFMNLISQNALPQGHYRENKTPTWEETIAFFRQADSLSASCKLIEYGLSDSGKPIHLFVISKDQDFDRQSIRNKNKLLILVNNGIHPGEPDGTDASIELTREILEGKFNLPGEIVLAIIPIYNVDGALNRSCCSRVNQDGPEEYGFRGNARYLDLNRDFIKMDSRNMESFAQLYQEWDPDMFIDNHVSNGADYQHTMTLITSQVNKLHPEVSRVMQEKLEPMLYRKMKEMNDPMVPYVNVWGMPPDDGYEGFDDSPRYATGYSALFHAFPFVTETHMLKPYARRVEATVNFMKCAIDAGIKLKADILHARNTAKSGSVIQRRFALQWKLDTSSSTPVEFNGYKAIYPVSKVTGLTQLKYDRASPFTRTIPFYNHFSATLSVTRPEAYFIPQSWREIIFRLKQNGVILERIEKDTILQGECYRIEDYQTPAKPFEGHYLHSEVKVSVHQREIHAKAGDFIVHCNQERNRFIIETLEPQAPDSWFAWGFFDAILQYKEGFSDYVFDDLAEEMLKNDPKLKTEFEEKKQLDPAFASSARAMHNWLYRRSKWAEPDAFIYPVVRIMK